MQGGKTSFTATVDDIDSILLVDIHVPDPTDVLYLIGDATSGGWLIEDATPMIQDADDPDRFTWTGTLRQGEFKLLTTTCDWLPCFVRDWEDSTKMHYRETNDDYPDHKWAVSPTGRYTVDAHIRNLTISVAPEPVYMIGDATQGGWYIENATPMRQDADDPEHFTWTGLLQQGEFKLLSSTRDWFPCYVRDWDDPTKMHLRNSEQDYHDYKWVIPVTGSYDVDAHIGQHTIIITSHAEVETAVPNPLACNKAAYRPGDIVTFHLDSMLAPDLQVRYTHLGQVLSQAPVNALSWTWQTPDEDFRGYMAELFVAQDDKDSVIATIGIDVSSEPSRFPRNGFLSSFSNMSAPQINAVLDVLNRYHINYIQFQDWHWKHHHPLAGTADNPLEEWKDLLGRNSYRSTIQSYIDGAHERGMLTLFYNLANGCLGDYADDGVSSEWMLYTDRQHTLLDSHTLGEPFKSNIFLANMHSQGWRDYIRARNDEVYSVFDFDGWQIDQLGPRPTTVYDYNGDEIVVWQDFGSFIANEKTAQPDKRLVMNAVWQFGQYGQIATSPVDFCYSEVWQHSDTDGYKVFSDIIMDNTKWSNGKQTVLAAYMDYALAKQGAGTFNTPGVLMATAVAAAWGGTILQMGEHMLCHEYFPMNNLSMSDELQQAMIRYYDFAVAYENLLRPDAPAGGINSDWFDIDVTSTVDTLIFNQWGPQRNQIATVGRHVGSRDVIHLLSYRNATHLDWCDTDGNQASQSLLTDIPVSMAVEAQPSRVWVATPDWQQGAAQEIQFSYANGQLSFTLPALRYWTMIVIEK